MKGLEWQISLKKHFDLLLFNVINSFINDLMRVVKLNDNWQKHSAERQKMYKTVLDRADKNAVLKQLPDLHEQKL